jgi:ectoine hydroxylase-related dioxygenase (phytanoyl-CoA dioxygenase family)
LLRKPVGLENNRLAPWHQDEAYWEPELHYPHALGAWLPLHDCPTEQGAMQFIPGSHRLGVLPHHYWGDDPADNLLVVDDVPEVDRSTAVPCPLPKGGCTFHHKRTLHHTAPNTTDRPRMAYATEIQVTPIRRDTDAMPDRPWVDQRRAVSAHDPMIDRYLADGRLAPVG